MLMHLILTIVYEVGILILEETEAQRVGGLPKVTQLVSKQSQDINLGILAPGV